jgi:hypothetical protein
LVAVPRRSPKFAAADAAMVTAEKCSRTPAEIYLKRNSKIGKRIVTMIVSWNKSGRRNRIFVLSFMESSPTI